MEANKENKDKPAPRWKGIGLDLFAVVSFASLVYGCWIIYPAAGFIVGGALGLAGAVMIAKGAG